MRRYKTYINGEWFEGTSGIVLRSVDPSNNQELGEIVQNSKEDVEYAIESASRSFYKTREWRDLDVQQRSDKLLKIADMKMCIRDSHYISPVHRIHLLSPYK